MTKLNTENTLKLAIKCANGLKAGTKNKIMTTDLLTAAIDAHLCGVGMIDTVGVSGEDFTVKVWETVEGHKESVAVLRALINRISKKLRKARGDKNPLALTVKDGKLVDVVPRNSKGGSEGGEGEGATDVETVKDNNNAALQSTLQQLDRMLKAEKDEKNADALRTAIAVLAASL